MTRMSLPEERALLGKGDGARIEPIALEISDDEMARFKEQARSILTEGGTFSTPDLHKIVARALLGMSL